jgi:serine/threonine protein phosphatase 1
MFLHMVAARFAKFFGQRARQSHAMPEGTRVYAVGDVHGCLEELNRLLDAIDEDLRQSAVESHLIFLGDLVDRGPQSAGVIHRIIESELPTHGWDCLMGNHEEVMLDCYEGRRETFDLWLRYGGVQTLESYGLRTADILGPDFDVVAAMQAAIPAKHIQFLNSLKDYVRLGDYLFVHAGIRPGVPPDEQSSRDLRWIRTGFLDDASDHGLMVVHGHTIVPEVEFRKNRIAVDTGCYLTGQLSALVLESDTTRVLTARQRNSALR